MLACGVGLSTMASLIPVGGRRRNSLTQPFPNERGDGAGGKGDRDVRGRRPSEW